MLKLFQPFTITQLITKSYFQANWILIPLFGICLFIVLYVIATYFYPGGSNFDSTAVGFNWQHNYWCELMNERAVNGSINKARPIAIGAMAVLCISLTSFWYNFSVIFHSNGWRLIRFAGIASMVIVVFLLVGPHDIIMSVAGILGIAALSGSLVVLFKMGRYKAFSLGAFCILLCVLNNYIYYSGYKFYYLPVIQKFTFFFFLLWFAWVDILMYRHSFTNPDVVKHQMNTK